MFCKNCGKHVSEDSNYCPYCGSYLMDNNINSKEDDPRVSKSSLFHTVNPINDNSTNKLNINNILHPKLTKNQKINYVLSIINTVIGLIALILMFLMFGFISYFITFKAERYPFILGVVIPLIVCLFFNICLNTHFLVLLIKHKIKIFRMIPIRVTTIVLELAALILLSIMLATLKPKGFNALVVISLIISLFAISLSWSTTTFNSRLKMFIK